MMIIKLLETGMMYESGGEHAWGMEYQVPDVIVWHRDGKDARKVSHVKKPDQAIHMLQQYHFGFIRMRMKVIF